LNSWITEKEAYLKVTEVSDNIPAARKQISKLEAYEREKARLTERNVQQLKALGADILAQKYSTKYSSYVFEHPEDIKKRESNIDSKWSQLSTLSAAKKKALDADLERELQKEKLRLSFAGLVTEFMRYTKDTADDVNVSSFGFTLEEVQSYKATLDKSNNGITQSLNTQQKEYETVNKQMLEMGVKDNVYTSLTLPDLAKARSTLEAAITKRSTAYDAELKRQINNDNICKQFAGLADPFVKGISDSKDKITRSKEELEQQLNFVQQKLTAIPQEASQLKPINDVYAQLEAAGIANNKHTTLTAKDVAVQWEQYQAFLKKKVQMLQEEIEHHKLRGVTQEQFQEIEDNFKQFDSDNSGYIDKKELKALLYSLGEEKSRGEVEQIMKKFGSSDVNGIKYAAFREFMIDLLGVSDTKDDILQSFKLINKGDQIAKVEKMEIVMDPKDIEYVKTTAGKVSGGYDYQAWTEQMFAR